VIAVVTFVVGFCIAWPFGYLWAYYSERNRLSRRLRRAIDEAPPRAPATPPSMDALEERAVRAAFETGRPVFADSDGRLQFCDGEQEDVP
jgi:hypothetical protein